MIKRILSDKKLLTDIILIGVLLAVGISGLIIWSLTSVGGNTVVVSVGGRTVAEYPLEIDGIYFLNGGTNILVIEDGYAYIREANCPGYQDCVERGRISMVGESIVCLPNELVVEITGEGEELIQ